MVALKTTLLCVLALLHHAAAWSWPEWSWPTDDVALKTDVATSKEDGRLLIFGPTGLSAWCGTSATEPTGECMHFSSCLMLGGTIDSSCGAIFTCCRYVINCFGVTQSTVAFWENADYPGLTTGPTTCQLTVIPSVDACYVRVEFIDTQLTASTLNRCDSNTLTIYNQAEGTGSPICSSLDNYETLVRVRTTRKGFLQKHENIRLLMNIRDTSYSYKIRITHIKCSQVDGVTGTTSFTSVGRSLDKNLEKSLNDIHYDNLESYLTGNGPSSEHFSNSSDIDNLDNVMFTDPQMESPDLALGIELVANQLLETDNFIDYEYTEGEEVNQEHLPTYLRNDLAVNDVEAVTNVLNDDFLLKFSSLADLDEEHSYSVKARREQNSNALAAEEDLISTEDKIANTKFNLASLAEIADAANNVDEYGNIGIDDLCTETESYATRSIAVPRLGPEPPTLIRALAPYFGTVVIRSEGGKFDFCSVTLIDEKYVLTAASCMLRNGYDSGMYDIRVFFDLRNEMPAANPYIRTIEDIWGRTPAYDVSRVVFHPMYDHNNFYYDIAVLELTTAVGGGNTPISLATDTSNSYDGTTVTEMGFGDTRDVFGIQSISTNGRYQTGSVISNSVCKSAVAGPSKRHADYGDGLVIDSTICIELGTEHQLCTYDRGGPIVTGFGTGSPVLIGIASGNVEDCYYPFPFKNTNLGKYPDIAVRITSVLDFIRAATTTYKYGLIETNGIISVFGLFFNFFTG